MDTEETVKKISLDELMETSYKLSPKVLSGLKECFDLDYTIMQACLTVGISTETYYQWIKQSDEFADLMELHQNDLKMKARGVIANLIKTGDPETVKWLLERREKKIYSPRTEVTGDEGSPITNDAKELKNIVTELQKLNGQSNTSSPNKEGNS